MSDEDLCYLSIAEAAAMIADRRLSPVELTQAVLARIDALNPRVNAYITVTADEALGEARDAEAAIMADGYLAACPVARDIVPNINRLVERELASSSGRDLSLVAEEG